MTTIEAIAERLKKPRDYTYSEVRDDAAFLLSAVAERDAIIAALPSLGYARRDEVLEEAAKVAETATALTYDNWTTSAQSGFDTGTRKAAMAIRSLKSTAPSQEKKP